MDIAQRVQRILLNPKEEWARIKAEPGTPAGLFSSYVAVLAAVPAVCQFAGNVIVGSRLPMVGWYRWPVGRALGNAIVSYAFALATVCLFALIINALAPSFASSKNMTNALRLAAYSMTPRWVAGILNVVPGLGFLGVLASLYGLFILYLGFETPMMDTPKDRASGYLVISVIVVIALIVVFELVLGGVYAVRTFEPLAL